jgi:hypothetical protein
LPDWLSPRWIVAKFWRPPSLDQVRRFKGIQE